MLGSNSIVNRVFSLHAVTQNQSHMPLPITIRNDSFNAKTGVTLNHARDNPIKTTTTKKQIKKQYPKSKNNNKTPKTLKCQFLAIYFICQ